MLSIFAMAKSHLVVALVGIGLLADTLFTADAVQGVTLCVAGWTLLEVIHLGKAMSAMQQKIKDLPCDNCPSTDELAPVKRHR
jgi:hypothetical protein